jgi:hypothetical protein
LIRDVAGRDVEKRHVAAMPVHQQDFSEAVVREALADVGNVIDERLAFDRYGSRKIHMVHIERVVYRGHQDRLERNLLHRQSRHFSRGKHIRHQR